MNIFVTILAFIIGIIAVLLIAGLFTRRKYFIRREIVINAPQQEVFEYLRFLKNHDHWNKWVMADPSMAKEFTGTDGTVGFIYGWNGKKGGEGEHEITGINDGREIDTELRFIRPFKAVGQTKTTVEAVGNQTKVTWSNTNQMMYPLNVMIVPIEKMLAKDMDTSLANVKRILERYDQEVTR